MTSRGSLPRALKKVAAYISAMHWATSAVRSFRLASTTASTGAVTVSIVGDRDTRKSQKLHSPWSTSTLNSAPEKMATRGALCSLNSTSRGAMIISERAFSDPRPLTTGRCLLSSVRKKSLAGMGGTSPNKSSASAAVMPNCSLKRP